MKKFRVKLFALLIIAALLFPMALSASAAAEMPLTILKDLDPVRSVSPNDGTHPAFGATLRQAAAAGVQVCAWDCDVTPDSLAIRCPVPVKL